MLPIRCILFDWSGTISDDRRVVFAANGLMRRDYGLPAIVYEEWLPTVTMTAYEHFVEAGVVVEPDALHAHYERRLNDVLAGGLGPTVYGDAAATLAALSMRGIRMGLVSSHPARNLLLEAEAYGLRGYFSGVIGGSRDKSADIRALTAELGAAPDETLYVGDTVHDIRHAKRANVFAAGITTGYHPRHVLAAEDPHALFDSLTELAARI